MRAIRGVRTCYWDKEPNVYNCSVVAIKLVQSMKFNKKIRGKPSKPSIPWHIKEYLKERSENDQYLIAGKILEALIFILFYGDKYFHLKPLSVNLQKGLLERNGHAHDGSFLGSFVPKKTKNVIHDDSASFPL